ncbi:MAG: hypothetical protein KC419_24600 [Anaerolineales bacterium]|nr:hypothetical protein [Anaerolineales bacterium]
MTQKQGLLAMAKYGINNAKAFRIYPLRDQSRTALTLANVKIGELDPKTAVYHTRVNEFNHAMIRHHQGKWYATKAVAEWRTSTLWPKAKEAFTEAIAIGTALQEKIENGDNTPIPLSTIPLTTKDTEIQFADEVPLVSDITPVVVVQGSSYEMGFQYAQQLVEIFGDWIMRQHAEHDFSEEALAELRRWEAQHQQHTPELLDFCRGWQAGANALDIPMSYDDVLDLWVGHKPPAKTYLSSGDGALPELPPLACTSLAAWGEATEDGKLVAGATGDHDMSYQVTIVAFPDDGIPFVYTTFGATGTLPTVGPNWFFGLPGMNLKGLTYVHHGGGPKMLEPPSSWGYGIRRGASVMHMLRYHETAVSAREQECAWPIGDIGYGDQATVGGFYADDSYGYIIESRQDPVAIREAGIMGERDFLFANNSVNHPQAIESEWMSRIRDEWQWDEDGGWRPKEPTGMTKSLGMILKWFSGRMSMDELMSKGMAFAYWNSYNRNYFLHTMARQGMGEINPDYLKSMYRTGGTMPERPWNEAAKQYKKDGSWGKISAAHASNALVVIMKPSEGLYSLCTGPALRGLPPMSPNQVISIHNERNAFWDLTLTETPEATLAAARELAESLITETKTAMMNHTLTPPLQTAVAALFTEIDEDVVQAKTAEQGGEMGHLAKALRAYTRIHVKARQIMNVLIPPCQLDY